MLTIPAKLALEFDALLAFGGIPGGYHDYYRKSGKDPGEAIPSRTSRRFARARRTGFGAMRHLRLVPSRTVKEAKSPLDIGGGDVAVG